MKLISTVPLISCHSYSTYDIRNTNTCYHVVPNCVSELFQPNRNRIFIFSSMQHIKYSFIQYLMQAPLSFLVRLLFSIIINFYWKLINCKSRQWPINSINIITELKSFSLCQIIRYQSYYISNYYVF